EEARKLHHPNITTLYDVAGSASRLHLALELVEGGTLARKLAGQPLQATEAVRMVELLANAVHHAHEQGLVHCHLQLANVLLGVPGETAGLSPVESRLGVPKLIGYEMARRREEQGAFEGLA